MIGALLALLSAATFALNNASVRRGVLSGSVLQAMAITVPLGAPLFLAAAGIFGSLAALSNFSPKAMLALATAGVLHFVWGRYWNYQTLRAIGLNLSALALQANLVITLAVAVWFLGETLTGLRILGIFLVLAGPMLLLRRTRSHAADRPDEKFSAPASREASDQNVIAFKPRMLEGYVFALLSALGYGLSPVFIRFGLADRSLATSFAGGLIAYVTATVIIAPVLMWPANLRHALDVEPQAAKWFAFSGILVCLSQMFLFMALAVAPVTVVSPISRLTLVFRLHFSRLLSPQHEVFGGRMIVATTVSLIGALVLSFNPELIESVLPVPDYVAAALKWHWP